MQAIADFLIILSWTALFTYWIASAFIVGDVLEELRMRGWVYAGVTFGVVLMLGVVKQGTTLPYPLDQLLWSPGSFMEVVGVAVGLGGLGILMWTRSVFVGAWDDVSMRTHTFTDTGPYAYVRHPAYTGFLLLLLGTVVVYGVLSGLVLWGVCASLLWVRAHHEERALIMSFTHTYRDYQMRVPMFVPFFPYATQLYTRARTRVRVKG